MPDLSTHVAKPFKPDLYRSDEFSESIMFIYRLVAEALADGAEEITFSSRSIAWPGPDITRSIAFPQDLRPFVAKVRERDPIMADGLVPLDAGEGELRLALKDD